VSPTPNPTRRESLDSSAIQQKKKQRRERERRPLGNSEFVQGEAQESDEETFGFVKSRDDDEDLNEDLDKTLETLVDDKEMDEDTVAEDKALEKYK
jgi:mediator of replication checkpoint protein 1